MGALGSDPGLPVLPPWLAAFPLPRDSLLPQLLEWDSTSPADKLQAQGVPPARPLPTNRPTPQDGQGKHMRPIPAALLRPLHPPVHPQESRLGLIFSVGTRAGNCGSGVRAPQAPDQQRLRVSILTLLRSPGRLHAAVASPIPPWGSHLQLAFPGRDKSGEPGARGDRGGLHKAQGKCFLSRTQGPE